MLRSRWVQHPAFWMLSFLIFLRLFGYKNEHGLSSLLDLYQPETDLIYTFLFHLSIGWVVYVNLDLLLPRFFQKGKYLLYLLAVLALLASGIALNLFTFNTLTDWIFPGYYFISYHTWWDIFQILLVYLLITTLLKLSKSWFQLKEQERRMDELEKEKLSAELSTLRNQLNPHFLFNHLNTLYALALEKAPHTADYIIKLSDHLRHLTYGNRSESIPLKEEIDWMKNYLALQEIKGGRNYELEIRGDLENKRIPPLLFLPLLENAFKHGDLDREALRIEVDAREKQLSFLLQNAVRDPGGEQTGGIGLANVRRRLELLFPDQHQLWTRQTADQFRVELKIPAL